MSDGTGDVDEPLTEFLSAISVEELEPAKRYRCARCETTWTYRDGPEWWRCPTPRCLDWTAQTRAPRPRDVMRLLSGRRPDRLPGDQDDLKERVRPRRGGRPRGPVVPEVEITAAYETLRHAAGRYPSDQALAARLSVSEATVRQYRHRGYLPPRDDPVP